MLPRLAELVRLGMLGCSLTRYKDQRLIGVWYGRHGTAEYVFIICPCPSSELLFLMSGCLAADYGASKAALINLHESLRYELDHVYKAPTVRTTLVIAGHILTPLFSAVRHPASWLYKFFFPSLPPVDVTKAIIAALDEQHSRVIYLPFYAHFVPYLHVFPSYLRDLAQWVSSIFWLGT